MAKKAVERSRKAATGSRADVLAALQAKFPGRVFAASEYTSSWELRRFPTGISSIDIALNGGLPAGGLSMFIAEPGVGKNYLANCVIAKAQETWGEDLMVGCIGTEIVYDKSQARFCGVQVALSKQEVDGRREGYKEFGEELTKEEAEELQTQVGTFVIVPPDTAERLFDIAIEMVRSRRFHIVLIDSFGSLLLDEDKDKTLDDNDRMAGPAMINSRFVKKLNEAMSIDDKGDPNLTCVIGINQVRDNMNRRNPNSPMKKESGGWAIKHARWVCIEMTRTSWLKDGTGAKARRIGKYIQWEMTKQKAGGYDGHKGEFLYRMESGCDFAEELVMTAMDYDLVNKSGNTYVINDEDKTSLTPTKRKGKAAAANTLRDDPELYDWLYHETLREAGVRCRTK